MSEKKLSTPIPREVVYILLFLIIFSIFTKFLPSLEGFFNLNSMSIIGIFTILIAALFFIGVHLLDKNIKFRGELTKEEVQSLVAGKRASNGHFSFEGGHFTYGESLRVKYCDIDKIIGYRRDLYYLDQIGIEIHLKNNTVFRWNEDEEGFHSLVSYLKHQFKSIPDEWELILTAQEPGCQIILFQSDGNVPNLHLTK